MRTRNYFKYLLAAIVAIGTSVNVMADEATYKFNYESQTVELQTIKAPYGTSVTLNAPFKRASKTLFSWLNDNYKDRVYLDNNAEGSIDFTGFRYEVTAVTMYVMANPNISGNNLYTDVKNFYNDETAKQSNTFRIGFSQGNGLTFGENKFLDKDMTPINGLGQLYLKGLSNNNHAFFRGANNETSATFKITYNRPVVSTRFVSGSNGSEIEGYISAHAGAFLENGQLAGGAYFNYTSDNKDILEFKNSKSGKMTFHKGGSAGITVSLIYGGRTIAHYDQTISLSTITLDHNDGTGAKEQIVVQKDQSMPAIVIPTRHGYVFNGYWDSNDYSDYHDNGNKYYDSNAVSVRSWDKSSNSTLYAHWKVRAYKVIYHSNDSRNIREEKNVSLSNYQVEYSSAQDWIAGYTFKGWSYSTNGSVDLQQGNNISPDNVNINEETKELHLYAVWQANEYALTLDPQGGTGGTTTVTASFGQSMPEIQIPTRAGYTFNGYWDSSSNKYYDVDGSSARNWDKSDNANATLYAHWTPIKYVLTLNAGPNTVIPTTDFGNGTHSYIVSEDRTTITMDVSLEENLGLFHNGVPKKPGFKFVGFYVDDILVASATGDKGRNLEFTNNAYINNSVWKYTDNLTLTARWIPKYTLSDNVLTFNDGEYLEVGIDWQSGKVNDLLGATEYEVQQGHISSDNPVMAFDIRNVIYQDGSSNNAYNLMQGLQNKNYISPNALVYVGSDAYSEYKVNNVIRPLGQGDEAKFNNLVVTDRYPIKIIDDFTAQTAIYERNKAFINDDNDAMWQQSKDSKWGTLCLPYPIKNNQKYDMNGVKYTIRFYELHNTYGNGQGQEYMQFYEMKEADQVIAANTPVLYCRTEGSAGSDITVKATNVEVHANAGYGTKPVNYKDKVDRKEAEESVMYWKFVGTLQTKEYCGAEYNGRVADGVYQNIDNKMGATFIDHNKMEIYFFESDKFKKLSRKGKIILYPYRAFFEDHTITYLEQSGESKVSSYSILVVDADGTTTDITNLVGNSNAKGDGKIYDLSGRRVKQPVKGSIYIVDGKKKMY